MCCLFTGVTVGWLSNNVNGNLIHFFIIKPILLLLTPYDGDVILSNDKELVGSNDVRA